MALIQEITFAGDELILLSTLDRTGCTMTDERHFCCDPEKNGVSLGSRLPVWIRGELLQEQGGWRIRYYVAPTPRTVLIAVIFGVLFAAMLTGFLLTGEGLTGVAFSAILCAAMIVNYLGQYKLCMKRFANLWTR